MAYCQASDLYQYGLPRGSVPRQARMIASVDTDGDTLTLDGHGFSTDDALTFRAEAGGSLPSPLEAGETYYAIAVDSYRFQVSATAGGDAINLTTEGDLALVIPPDPIPGAIAWATGMIDDMVPANVVPMAEPYTPSVVSTCAELAAWKLLSVSGAQTDAFRDVEAGARKRLERWAKGVPIRGENQPTAASQAASQAVPRGTSAWSRHGGIR